MRRCFMKSKSNVKNDKLQEIKKDLDRCKALKIVSITSAALSTGIAGTSLRLLITAGIELAPNASIIDKIALCGAALLSAITSAFAAVNVSRAKTDIKEIKAEEADLKKEKEALEKAI